MSEQVCIKCGHERRFSDNEGGVCEKYNSERLYCGCRCEFVERSLPETEAEEQMKDQGEMKAQNTAVPRSGFAKNPSSDAALSGEIDDRDALIETITELEKDRDELRQVARMSLQQFEFTYGERKRGWDIRFLMGRLRKAIADSEMSGDGQKIITCLWLYDESDDKWDTTCGEAFQVSEGDPYDNGMRYCCYCGKGLRQRYNLPESSVATVAST